MIYYEGPLKGSASKERVFDILNKEAVIDSANYIKPFIKDCVIMEEKWWGITLNHITKKGLHLEFGVHRGESINYFAQNKPDITWYGFDSFEGLQEDWKGGMLAKGHFTLNGKEPKVLPNVSLIKGWFKDTLPLFLSKNKNKMSFIHIDCDTYESTKDVFDCIDKSLLQKGTIVLFDEYMGYTGWRENEFKAWQEYVNKNKIKYKYIAFGEEQALIKIL
jgi:hypothetical protein|tara:strand:+ start:1123 stop:1779 length:657 start_codon:yes stop_codon:yes gene_type:complete